jgi:hypothetical protein
LTQLAARKFRNKPSARIDEYDNDHIHSETARAIA